MVFDSYEQTSQMEAETGGRTQEAGVCALHAGVIDSIP